MAARRFSGITSDSFKALGENLDHGNAEEARPLIRESSPPGGSCWGLLPDGFWNELLPLIKMALPIVLFQLSQSLLGPLALVYCGHLGTIELDGVSLANSIINVTCIAMGNGLGTACDTFYSQSYGSSHRDRMGTIAQRSVLTFALVVLPVWAIHLNIGNIIAPLGNPVEVIDITSQYLLIFMPGSLAFFMNVTMAKYVLAQGIVYPLVIIGLIVNAWNAASHYLLVYALDLQTDGSAVALMSSHILFLVLIIAYIRCFNVYKDTWSGWGWECLIGWGDFTLLALYGMVMTCMEWWVFEAGVFLAAYLGVTALAVQTVLFTYETNLFMLPFGTSIASSIRIGNYLGAGDGKRARAAGIVTYTLTAMIALVTLILLLALKAYLPLAFTNDPEVIEGSEKLLPLVACFVFFDAAGATGTGILRGCGLQWIATLNNTVLFTSALFIWVPLMLHFWLLDVFWYTMVGTMVLESIIFIIVILKIKWNKCVEQAKYRTSEYEIIEGDDDKGDHYGYASLSDYGRSLVTRRIAASLVFLALFVAGVVVRVAYPPPSLDSGILPITTTDAYNTTGSSTLLPTLSAYVSDATRSAAEFSMMMTSPGFNSSSPSV